MSPMPADDMVERVALAIEAKLFAPHELPLDGETHEKYREAAKAAIGTMREPTDHMGYAGLIATNGNSIYGWPDEHRQAAFKALGDIGYGDKIAGNPSHWMKPIWRAMIDAAIPNEIARCPKCGRPHSDQVIGFAKAIGASVALCRMCTAIEKRERFGIMPEPLQ